MSTYTGAKTPRKHTYKPGLRGSPQDFEITILAADTGTAFEIATSPGSTAFQCILAIYIRTDADTVISITGGASNVLLGEIRLLAGEYLHLPYTEDGHVQTDDNQNITVNRTGAAKLTGFGTRVVMPSGA